MMRTHDEQKRQGKLLQFILPDLCSDRGVWRLQQSRCERERDFQREGSERLQQVNGGKLMLHTAARLVPAMDGCSVSQPTQRRYA